ncbi:MAG: NUDIX domain-containing protein [Clostridia bacterium]|nr:NUDIX domain-containing protein [Clostridia bacterium]
MDITIDVGEYKLNIRTSAIIIHDGKVLLHKNKNDNHYALLGGRIGIGEDSETAAKREVMEELGKEIEITGNVATVENFFEMKGSKYHEILFAHRAEFKKDEDKKITHTLKNIEGKDHLQYEWIDIDKLDDYKVLPEAMKSILKENKFPVHKINNDMI